MAATSAAKAARPKFKDFATLAEMTEADKTQQFPIYDVVGQVGKRWTSVEIDAWRARQRKVRDYFAEIVSPLMRIGGYAEVIQYGSLDYRAMGAAYYPLVAVKSTQWDPARQMVLVTGGVHGYESSGYMGSLQWATQHMQKYCDKFNVLVLPCICPFGMEVNHRWTPLAIDPNRQFRTPDRYDEANWLTGCPEAVQAMACIQAHIKQCVGCLVHIDCHDTTQQDNFEFTPTKVARNGADPDSEQWTVIPPGWYSVASADKGKTELDADQLAFQKAIIAAVEKVTPISPPDENNEIIGDKVVSHGIIVIDGHEWGICGAHLCEPTLNNGKGVKFSITTETFPKVEPSGNDAEANAAQIACINAGLDYAAEWLKTQPK